MPPTYKPSPTAVTAAIGAVKLSPKGAYYATTRKDAVRAAVTAESPTMRGKLAQASDAELSWYYCTVLEQCGCLRLSAQNAFMDCEAKGFAVVNYMPGTKYLRKYL